MPELDLASVTLVVGGQVQGVFYRASTLEQAQRLGLTGWVKNLADGGVEIVAEGTRRALHDLIAWCKEGPPAADVTEVIPTWGKHTGSYRTFTISG